MREGGEEGEREGRRERGRRDREREGGKIVKSDRQSEGEEMKGEKGKIKGGIEAGRS